MIIGAMRVKNEARGIGRAVRSLVDICDWVYVLDDRSSDNTPTLAIEAGARFVEGQPARHGLHVDEARDKTYLVERIRTLLAKDLAYTPEDYWVLMLDGDEELLPFRPKELIERCAAPALTFRIAFLWDREDQVRVDGVYKNFTRPSAFHMARTTGIFRDTAAGANFHCGSVPYDLRGQSVPSHLIMRHFGYLRREDRVRKYAWYNQIDPGNYTEDEYRHMVIGDLFPAGTCCKHGGPLELQPWEEWA